MVRNLPIAKVFEGCHFPFLTAVPDDIFFTEDLCISSIPPKDKPLWSCSTGLSFRPNLPEHFVKIHGFISLEADGVAINPNQIPKDPR
jgi:hypothetical protein